MSYRLSLRHWVWLFICSMHGNSSCVGWSVWKSQLAWSIHSVWHSERRKFLSSCANGTCFGSYGSFAYIGRTKGFLFGGGHVEGNPPQQRWPPGLIITALPNTKGVALGLWLKLSQRMDMQWRCFKWIEWHLVINYLLDQNMMKNSKIKENWKLWLLFFFDCVDINNLN